MTRESNPYPPSRNTNAIVQAGIDRGDLLSNFCFMSFCLRKFVFPKKILRQYFIVDALRNLINLADEHYVIRYRTLVELTPRIVEFVNAETVNRYLKKLRKAGLINWSRAYRGHEGVITLKFCKNIIQWNPNWYDEQLEWERSLKCSS